MAEFATRVTLWTVWPRGKHLKNQTYLERYYV